MEKCTGLLVEGFVDWDFDGLQISQTRSIRTAQDSCKCPACEALFRTIGDDLTIDIDFDAIKDGAIYKLTVDALRHEAFLTELSNVRDVYF